MTRGGLQARLVEAAAEPYRAAGRYAWHFARGKLRGDPVFPALLRDSLIPADADILDLGCGQGLLAAWLSAAAREHAAGGWPAGWAAPPRLVGYRGIEQMPIDVARARAGLPAIARVERGDIRRAGFGRANTVVILDVLHYLQPGEQRAVLERVRDALEPAGLLLLRVGDAAAGMTFKITLGVDRLVTRLRGQSTGRLHCRPLADWNAEVRMLGFSLDTQPMSAGTPFANHLLIARVGSRMRDIDPVGLAERGPPAAQARAHNEGYPV